ncbi:hypothetical protein HPP92_021124 [Vanilla planifolia]|uniref:Pre-mRNA-splicing factor SYF2 n=1 Tax=Vanilla planifolia TaxID=51239 RepID=A0A835Q4Z4_VANPL|nr:hypothetical protein HPP92_021124 [Vanilla planifolia]
MLLLCVVFNQKVLYNAYKKRTKKIEVDMDANNKAKEADLKFYRDASSPQYKKVVNPTQIVLFLLCPRSPQRFKGFQENIDRMVKELHDRQAKCNAFGKWRKFHEEKDIDSINDFNGHFNKKIERAFGKYTLKNNLEKRSVLPD